MRLTERQAAAIEHLNAAHDVSYRWLGGKWIADKLGTSEHGAHQTMASLVRRGIAVRATVDRRACYRLADRWRQS